MERPAWGEDRWAMSVTCRGVLLAIAATPALSWTVDLRCKRKTAPVHPARPTPSKPVPPQPHAISAVRLVPSHPAPPYPSHRRHHPIPFPPRPAPSNPALTRPITSCFTPSYALPQLTLRFRGVHCSRFPPHKKGRHPYFAFAGGGTASTQPPPSACNTSGSHTFGMGRGEDKRVDWMAATVAGVGGGGSEDGGDERGG